MKESIIKSTLFLLFILLSTLSYGSTSHSEMGTLYNTNQNLEFSVSEVINDTYDSRRDTEKVNIINKTGKDIYIYENGSRNSTTIRANSSTKVDCTSSYTYKFDPNSSESGTSCYKANSVCGEMGDKLYFGADDGVTGFELL